ncbi:hypothetical protein SeMB42_g02313 [Synchytrium endobioticum]|uniref:RING-type domain-containing protein n=1 Tax=Synchytrium endobioticum TaxID=286115 RepID=A0A507DHC5_9FUNG|nr:hypothetical protein SeLEV6574_g03106 [Synchytrium endobioticum]TPX50240.1 hypothetical protein SeMB42_g02313 [Synchytrium endobioticum]
MGNNNSSRTREDSNATPTHYSAGTGAADRHDHKESVAVQSSSVAAMPTVKHVTIDGGQLIPLSALYQENYDPKIVRKLIMERRIAPFYTGLPDPPDQDLSESHSNFSSSPIATPFSTASIPNNPHDAATRPTTWTTTLASQSQARNAATAIDSTAHTSVRLVSTSTSSVSDLKANKRSTSFSTPALNSTIDTAYYDIGSHSPPLLELYAGAIECPICFLYYPKTINYTRCCEKPLCTECFLQIRRPETNFEPATCPYCVEPHFGIVYKPPSSYIVSGKAINTINVRPSSPTAHTSDHISLLPSRAPTSSLLSTGSMSPSQVSILERTLREDDRVGNDKGKTAIKRQSYSFRHQAVVTSDEIRPDWKQRQQEAAMRAAASTRTRHHFLAAGGTGAGAGAGHRGRLFRESVLLTEHHQELAGAAAAAASLVENITALTSGARSHAARRLDSRESLRSGGSHSLSRRLSSSQESNHSGSRNSRSNTDSPNFAYLEAMRHMGADIEELMVMEAVRRSLAEAQDAAEKQAQEQDVASLARRQAAADRAAAATAAASAKSVSNMESLDHLPPTTSSSYNNSTEAQSKEIAQATRADTISSSSASHPACSSSASSPLVEPPQDSIASPLSVLPPHKAAQQWISPSSTTTIMTATITVPSPPKTLEPTPSTLPHGSSIQALVWDHSSEDIADHRSYSEASRLSSEDPIEPEPCEAVHRNILLPSGASMLSNTEPYGDAASMRTGHVTAFSLYSGETGDEVWTMTHPPSIVSQQPPTSLAPGRPSMSLNMDRETLNDNDAASMSSTRALKSLKSEYIGSGGSMLGSVNSAGYTVDLEGNGSSPDHESMNAGSVGGWKRRSTDGVDRNVGGMGHDPSQNEHVPITDS